MRATLIMAFALAGAPAFAQQICIEDSGVIVCPDGSYGSMDYISNGRRDAEGRERIGSCKRMKDGIIQCIYDR